MSSAEKAKGHNKETEMPENVSFETPLPPIPSEDIKKTVTADVVVVGCGISGMSAALSAAEAGAKTILLEKTATSNQRGGHNATLNSRLQKKVGIIADKDQVVATIMEYGGYRADQRVVNLWAENCSSSLDWLMEKADAANVRYKFIPAIKDWYFPNYPVMHVFEPDGQQTLGKLLLDNVKAQGVDIHFNTPSVRLIRKGKGRVTGVIAKNPEGGYAQFNAGKGVILCTGDYGGDIEMVKKYCWPGVSELGSMYKYTVPDEQIINTGDGHKMGMWVGAAIDDAPHCALLFDWMAWGGSHMPDMGIFLLGRQPWLYVNANGERFMNEDVPWGYEAAQIMRQPGIVSWAVWDDKWDQEWPKMKSQCCKNMTPGENMGMWQPEFLEMEVKNGHVLKAQTIEELGQKMNVPVDTFKATVTRYTELARGGKDLDFGKHPDRLTTLEKPPYYATQVTARYLVILSGLKINTELQVLDTEGNAIPGLYAAGNTSGSFFANQYPTTVPGLSHSRAFTFGRLAGQNVAAEKV